MSTVAITKPSKNRSLAVHAAMNVPRYQMPMFIDFEKARLSWRFENYVCMGRHPHDVASVNHRQCIEIAD